MVLHSLSDHQAINAVGGEVLHVSIEEARSSAVERAVAITDDKAHRCRAVNASWSGKRKSRNPRARPVSGSNAGGAQFTRTTRSEKGTVSDTAPERVEVPIVFHHP